jgi:hypothetical protein
MPQNFDRNCDRLRFPETLTVSVLENSGEIRPADLPRDLHQPPANAAEHATRRLPCSDTLRKVAFRGFTNRHAGVPGSQHSECVGIGKVDGARFRRSCQGEARFHDMEFSPEMLP